jgi:hypothetical protein
MVIQSIFVLCAAATFPLGQERDGDHDANRRVLDIVVEVEHASTEYFASLGRFCKECV